MLPEKLSTDLTSLSEGEERLAIVMEMVVAADGTVTAGDIYRAVVLQSRQACVQRRCRMARGHGARAAQARRRARAGRTAAHAGSRSAGAESAAARAWRAAAGDAKSRPYSKTARWPTCCRTKNRAKELIEDFMIAANGVTARYLEKKGFPSLRRVLHAQALGPHRRAGGGASGSGCRRRLTLLRWMLSSPRAPAARPGALSPTSRCRWSSYWARASTRSRCPASTRGTLRARGEGLHAFDGAEPPLSRSDRAAAAEGRARWGRASPYSNDELTALAATLHRAGGQRGKGGTPSRKSAAALLLRRASVSGSMAS